MVYVITCNVATVSTNKQHLLILSSPAHGRMSHWLLTDHSWLRRTLDLCPEMRCLYAAHVKAEIEKMGQSK